MNYRTLLIDYSSSHMQTGHITNHLLPKKWGQEQIHCYCIKPQLITHYSPPVFFDDSCGAWEYFLFIFRAAVLVPPHAVGWTEKCADSQFTWSLGFKRGGQRRFPTYSMGIPFKTQCTILSKPVVSLWETKTLVFHDLSWNYIISQGQGEQLNAGVRSCLCMHSCVFFRCKIPYVTSETHFRRGTRPGRRGCRMNPQHSPRL